MDPPEKVTIFMLVAPLVTLTSAPPLPDDTSDLLQLLMVAPAGALRTCDRVIWKPSSEIKRELVPDPVAASVVCGGPGG